LRFGRQKFDLDESGLMAAHDEVVVPKPHLHGASEKGAPDHFSLDSRYKPKVSQPLSNLSAKGDLYHPEPLSRL